MVHIPPLLLLHSYPILILLRLNILHPLNQVHLTCLSHSLQLHPLRVISAFLRILGKTLHLPSHFRHSLLHLVKPPIEVLFYLVLSIENHTSPPSLLSHVTVIGEHKKYFI